MPLASLSLAAPALLSLAAPAPLLLTPLSFLALFRSSLQLLKFHSDPPTVTTQRLQALTTGGLPTFGDISSSFDANQIGEDSWLRQLKRRNSTVFFSGDDTWTKLYDESYFSTSHPYPSFNTRDIDTVDKGIESHLDELASVQPRPLVTILHFLGVDHVGHTYGPGTPEMKSKLEWTDKILAERVLPTLSSPPTAAAASSSSSSICHVSFVCGDHGMTESGNHGGGSSEETTAGLYVRFSSGCMFEKGR